MLECSAATSSAEDLDALFIQALVGCLRRVGQEIAIARGRLGQGHRVAKAHLTDARGHVRRTLSEVETLGHVVWGAGFGGTTPLAMSMPLEDALDVLALRRWCWALRICAEDVTQARCTLSRSRRQRVTHAMLADAHDRVVRASSGIEQLSRRAWGIS